MDCNTKYPILLVHGAGFRDRKHFGYWGRIPGYLAQNGAQIYYGGQDSRGSIEENAKVIKANLLEIINKNKCSKFNIIAHSKGGLEARYMISSLNMEEYAASLTTVATPHHGSKTIDLLCRIPSFLYKAAAYLTDLFFKMLGDKNPDFYTASRQFSTAHMKEFNAANPDAKGIYYQSYAFVMKNPLSDIFLFWCNLFVKLIEGENDGLVTPESAKWADFKGIYYGSTNRGISHADEVDVRRMNFSKKICEDKNAVNDIRAFYVNIVCDLKQKGL